MSSSHFDDVLGLVLKNEGGLVNDPSDRGGLTNFGITIRSFCVFLYPSKDPNILSQDPEIRRKLKNITIDEVKKFYKEMYWDRIHGDEMLRDMSFILFDQAINRGVATTVKALQSFLNISGDGIMGPETLEAIKLQFNSGNSRKKIQQFIFLLQLRYINIVKNDISQLKFLSGWIARTHHYFEVI